MPLHVDRSSTKGPRKPKPEEFTYGVEVESYRSLREEVQPTSKKARNFLKEPKFAVSGGEAQAGSTDACKEHSARKKILVLPEREGRETQQEGEKTC